MHADGNGIPVSWAEGGKWFAMAAEQGHCESQFALGKMYVNGRGVAQNTTTGVIWLEKAARNQKGGVEIHAKACFLLGSIPFVHPLGELGEGSSGELDDHEQRRKDWWEEAAGLGSVEAMNGLAGLLQSELVSPQDKELGRIWARRLVLVEGHPHQPVEDWTALEAKAKANDTNAQFQLAGAYFQSENGKEHAVPWLQRAAVLGHADAQYRLSEMYTSGQVPDQHEDGEESSTQWHMNGERFMMRSQHLAHELLMKAADGGLTKAQHALATMYFNGKGIAPSPDLVQAVDWWTKAAEVSSSYLFPWFPWYSLVSVAILIGISGYSDASALTHRPIYTALFVCCRFCSRLRRGIHILLYRLTIRRPSSISASCIRQGKVCCSAMQMQ
jgi:TPR repeat protein